MGHFRITFAQYQSVVAWAHNRHPEWRRGQTAYNVLRRWRPELTDQVLFTPLDPFYQDDRLQLFLSFIEERW